VICARHRFSLNHAIIFCHASSACCLR
jgi:hypothetical protein